MPTRERSRVRAELAELVKNGKTIVSISCSIHSTEIVASQMSMNLAYELATANDADTKEILDNTILLLIPSPNPDGVADRRRLVPQNTRHKSEGTSPPELYHHYAGHDDNRDWFMLNLDRDAGDHKTVLAAVVSADRLRRSSAGPERVAVHHSAVF